MKNKLRDKYVPTSYFDRLLDDWHWFTQDTKSAKDYLAQFDEFLIRCSTFGTKSITQVISQFRAGLREDIQTELLARGVTKLDKAYAIIQELNSIRINHTFTSYDYRASVSRFSPSP